MKYRNEKDKHYVKVFEDLCQDGVYVVANGIWNRISLDAEDDISSEVLKGYVAWIRQGFETNTLAQTQAERVKVDRIDAILQIRKEEEEESSEYSVIEVEVRRGKSSHSRVRYTSSENTANRVYHELKRHLNSCVLE